MATSSRRSGLTTTGIRLVEQYVSVLDYISRCAQAIDHGDWFYLYDKAGTLAGEAKRLAAIAREAYDAPRRPRKQVGAAVAWFGRQYRAARLLHPLEPEPAGGERRWGCACAAPGRGRPAAAGRLLRGPRPVPPLPDRPPSRLVRVYLDLRLPTPPAPAGPEVAGGFPRRPACVTPSPG